MINSAKYLGYFLLLCIIFMGSPVYGHAEKDKSRYVSPDGVNIGLCDNPLRPCKTISYATSRAAKGDKVLVSAGNYHLNSIDEILTFKSQIIPIKGGYNKFDHFSSQSPSTNITQLTGLPSDLTDYARNQGFKVIADGKSKFSRQQISRINDQSVAGATSHGSAKCHNGIAIDFPCNNLELVSHVALNEFSLNPPTASDIWGHVDLNTGQEYALIGTGNGVVVFDLTIPESPREVGTIAGLASSWRDIKVYQYFDYALNAWQAYAYATVDYSNDNVMIINLNQLPHSVSLVKKDIAVRQAHNVYISNVDYTYNISLNSQTPTLQFVGSEGNSVRSTSFLSYSLENPTSLSILPVGKNKTSGYTHDGTSLVVEDDRTQIDCGLSVGDACKIFIDFSEKEIKLWNVTTPGEEKKLSDIIYNDVSKDIFFVFTPPSRVNILIF